jgi:hypothetical protein
MRGLTLQDILRQLITLKMSTRDHRAEHHSPEFVMMPFTLRI